MGTVSLLDTASSGHDRNCSFWPFSVGLFCLVLLEEQDVFVFFIKVLS